MCNSDPATLCPMSDAGARSAYSDRSQTANGSEASFHATSVSRCRNQWKKSVHVEYTDVVVIGNGPSGICMSYVLSGHWPFYTGGGHSNELLTMRLQSEGTGKSLLELDLAYLSDGLEGRTSNPVALLVDALCNPDADLGVNSPSLVRWDYHPDHVIPHVVLGQYDEGGIWQTIDDDIQSLSLGEWMELPDMSFTKWREQRRSSCRERANSESRSDFRANRATAAEVRGYYSQYVDSKGLRQFFRNRSTVTSVTRVRTCPNRTDGENGESLDGDNEMCGPCPTMWEVCGFREVGDSKTAREEFCYRCESVVLANGAFDVPNVLHVPGENRPYIVHSLQELDQRIRKGEVGGYGDPVVVIGSGLSAADAILRVRAANLPVAHVFRQRGHDPCSVFRQLPPALYPEYDAVHRLMKSSGDQSANVQYRSYAAANIVEFTANNEVVLKLDNNDEQFVVVRSSCVVVLIGSRPNLSFLGEYERNIGRVSGVAVDGKRNPVNADPYTYQIVHYPGLYAVGPLVGDNFVRFLRGGAVGVAAHIWSKRRESSLCDTKVTKL